MSRLFLFANLHQEGYDFGCVDYMAMTSTVRTSDCLRFQMYYGATPSQKANRPWPGPFTSFRLFGQTCQIHIISSNIANE